MACTRALFGTLSFSPGGIFDRHQQALESLVLLYNRRVLYRRQMKKELVRT